MALKTLYMFIYMWDVLFITINISLLHTLCTSIIINIEENSFRFVLLHILYSDKKNSQHICLYFYAFHFSYYYIMFSGCGCVSSNLLNIVQFCFFYSFHTFFIASSNFSIIFTGQLLHTTKKKTKINKRNNFASINPFIKI